MAVVDAAVMHTVQVDDTELDGCIATGTLRTRCSAMPEMDDEADLRKVKPFEEVAIPLFDPVQWVVTMSVAYTGGAHWAYLVAVTTSKESHIRATGSRAKAWDAGVVFRPQKIVENVVEMRAPRIDCC